MLTSARPPSFHWDDVRCTVAENSEGSWLYSDLLRVSDGWSDDEMKMRSDNVFIKGI